MRKFLLIFLAVLITGVANSRDIFDGTEFTKEEMIEFLERYKNCVPLGTYAQVVYVGGVSGLSREESIEMIGVTTETMAFHHIVDLSYFRLSHLTQEDFAEAVMYMCASLELHGVEKWLDSPQTPSE